MADQIDNSFQIIPYKDIPLGGMWKFVTTVNKVRAPVGRIYLKVGKFNMSLGIMQTWDVDMTDGVVLDSEEPDHLVYYIPQIPLMMQIP